MRPSRTTLSGLALAAMAVAATAEAAPNPTGLWIDHTGRGAVEITQCGASLCGKIVWLKDGRNAKACGMQVLGDVRASGGGNWGGGWIYSPERKSRYDVELTPIGDDKLKVFGYAGVRMFGKTMTWTRAPEGLERCGDTITAGASTTSPPSVAAAVATGQTTRVAPADPKVAAPAAEPAPVQTAEAEPVAAEPAAPESAETPKKSCKVRLPYVTLTFPCPE